MNPDYVLVVGYHAGRAISLAVIDVFQPHHTAEHRSTVMEGDCGGLISLSRVTARIDEYLDAE